MANKHLRLTLISFVFRWYLLVPYAALAADNHGEHILLIFVVSLWSVINCETS